MNLLWCLSIIAVIMIGLLVLALYWESILYSDVNNITPISSLSGQEQVDQLKNLVCWNYEYGVFWRGVLIATIIVVLLAALVLLAMSTAVPALLPMIPWLLLLILALDFLVFYGVSSVTSYHVHHELCNKVREYQVR